MCNKLIILFLFCYAEVIAQATPPDHLKDSLIAADSATIKRIKIQLEILNDEYGTALGRFMDSLVRDTTNSSDKLSFLFDTTSAKIPANSYIELRPNSWTNDYEHILLKKERDHLDSLISDFERQTSIEIAILTIRSNMVTPGQFDSLVSATARMWGVGKKDQNNGIVIGICTGLKKIRIENGVGVIAKLSDLRTKEIIENIFLPEFRKANYFDGIKKGLIAIMSEVR